MSCYMNNFTEMIFANSVTDLLPCFILSQCLLLIFQYRKYAIDLDWNISIVLVDIRNA